MKVFKLILKFGLLLLFTFLGFLLTEPRELSVPDISLCLTLLASVMRSMISESFRIWSLYVLGVFVMGCGVANDLFPAGIIYLPGFFTFLLLVFLGIHIFKRRQRIPRDCVYWGACGILLAYGITGTFVFEVWPISAILLVGFPCLLTETRPRRRVYIANLFVTVALASQVLCLWIVSENPAIGGNVFGTAVPHFFYNPGLRAVLIFPWILILLVHLENSIPALRFLKRAKRWAAILLFGVFGAWAIGDTTKLSREREWNFRFRLAIEKFSDQYVSARLKPTFEIQTGIPFSKFDEKSRERIRAYTQPRIQAWLDDDKAAILRLHGATYLNCIYDKDYLHSSNYLEGELEYWLLLAENPQTGLWEIERVLTEKPTAGTLTNGKVLLHSPRASALATPLTKGEIPDNIRAEDFFADGKHELKFSFYALECGLGFYFPKSKMREFVAKNNAVGTKCLQASAELFLRDNGAVVVRRLLVNGKEF